MDKTWKSVERKVASFFGGVRVPVTGRQRGDAPDILHPTLSIEVKHRKELPDWLFDAMNQAQESQRDNQIPMVLLHQKGMTIGESLTVFRASDILAMLKKIEDLEESLSEAYSVIRYHGGG